MNNFYYTGEFLIGKILVIPLTGHGTTELWVFPLFLSITSSELASGFSSSILPN